MNKKRGIVRSKKKSKNIPLTAAVNERISEPGDGKILYSFAEYRTPLCEIENLPRATARKALRVLKNMGMGNPANLSDSNVSPTPVHRTRKGDYARLFEGITPDVDVMEVPISSGGRCFYYRVGNRFLIRAIRENHLETR